MARIKLSRELANEFQQDDMLKSQYHQNYRCYENILLNPGKFPKADFAHVEWLVDRMFDHDPICAQEGL